MPPAVASQPEPAELDALELWIAQGAGEDATIQAASLPVSVAELAQHMLPSANTAPPTAVAAVPAVPSGTPESAKSPTNTEALAGLTPARGGCAACAVSRQDRNSPLPIALALLVGSTFLLRRRA
jgi:MYXO-CTERM domain-containing protein